MNLGFYYHITLSEKEGKLCLPGYLAVFINALALEVNQLILFLHEAGYAEIESCDTELNRDNIEWVNLGIKTPGWHRSIFHKNLLAPVKRYIGELDLLLIRGPSPLAPYFRNHIADQKKLIYLVVGDYKEGMKGFKIQTPRDVLVKWFSMYIDRKFKEAMNAGVVIVNSEKLFQQFIGVYNKIHLIRTTTLSNEDFHSRIDSIETDSSTINLLYTGRIVREKGLDNILKACFLLREEGISVDFHIAGILVPKQDYYIEELLKLSELNSQRILHYHGFK